MTSSKWIQSIGMKKGVLRNYVNSKYGKKCFTTRGTIKEECLYKILRDPRSSPRTKKRVQLALTFKKMKRK